MKGFKIALILFSISFSSFSQQKRDTDFEFWGWVQIEKKTFRRQYTNIQYQIRYDNNASTFNRSNIYFTYGFNFLKNWNTELLYQLNTNYKKDQHTFYVGNTYKFKLVKKTNLMIRTAVQHTINHLSGDYNESRPLTEWRNRVRVLYSFNKVFSSAISAEPYLAFDKLRPTYLSRIRYVFQFNFKYNKYQTLTLFYLIQPDIISYNRPQTKYVLGLTYSIKLPNKMENFRKLFKPKFLKYYNSDDDNIDNEIKDTFN